MTSFVKQDLRIGGLFGWYDRLEALLARELAPTSRKLRTALRFTTIATIGAGLIVSCHVNNQLGTYIVWLLVGAGPMMSLRKALAFIIAEALALVAAVIMARAFAETPWLMLPFLFAFFSYSTYLGTTRKLGAGMLLIEVVCLNVFYNVAYAPQEIGWFAAGAFGGSAIGFGVIVLFDNWIWPDPGEAILMKSLGANLARTRLQFLEAANFYLGREGSSRPPLPPMTSDLPAHMALLEQARVEGLSEHRRAILLAAVMRLARIDLEVQRLALATRQHVPRTICNMVRPELQAAVDALAVVFDEFARELPTYVPVGVDQRPPASRIRARAAMNALSAGIIRARPKYIGMVSAPEIENFATFTDSLAVLTGFIERLLDTPPEPPAAAPSQNAPRVTNAPDPEVVRYSLKVGVCVVAAYVVGLFTQRADLSTIMTTVLISALPTYGATVRKMILRIVGATVGGAVSLLVIIIVTPNFSTLPAYLIAIFIVFYLSGYASLTSGSVSYAGKQIGTTFALVFADLSPAFDVYEPLWRIWGVLIGTVVAGMIALTVWPEYAGDSLLPKLRRVFRDALALAPGGSAANTEYQIQLTNSDTMSTLGEIMLVADDAHLEGRASVVNHDAIINAAGDIRRIANRLASISFDRIVTPMPALDPATESAREAVLAAIRRRLESWLDFFNSDESLNASAAQQRARAHPADELERPIEEFSTRLEADKFRQIESWTFDQRRTIVAELHAMRRLEFLDSDLNRWLAQIPGSASPRGARGQ